VPWFVSPGFFKVCAAIRWAVLADRVDEVLQKTQSGKPESTLEDSRRCVWLLFRRGLFYRKLVLAVFPATLRRTILLSLGTAASFADYKDLTNT
jgi:hypothetical protein